MANGNGELTPKQEMWLANYLECFNATDAGRGVYEGNDNVLAQIGWQNLRKVKIKARVDQALSASTMSPEEILMRLSNTARANLADFASVRTLEDLKDHPNARAVKELKKNKDGTVILKLHDPGLAQERLAKCYSMFSEKIEIEPSKEFKQLLKDLKENGRKDE